MFQLEVIFDEAAFAASAMDIQDARAEWGEKEGEEFGDEAHAAVVSKRQGVFEAVGVV